MSQKDDTTETKTQMFTLLRVSAELKFTSKGEGKGKYRFISRN